jgi:hypothetical protein
MRVFGIQSDGTFSEYVQTQFQVDHEESILEDWIESNPDGIVEDGRILIIGRQVATNFGGFIDLLGLDREGHVIVVELKRDRTPRDTLAQALEYVSFAERLDPAQLEQILRSYLNDESLNLSEYHREYFQIGAEEAISFNKNQGIAVVGQRISPEIRQTASFLRSKGIKVTCVEFTFFQTDIGTRLLSQEIVVGKESEKPSQVTSGSLPIVTENAFMASLDENGKAVFFNILDLAREKLMPIHWGTKGFSLNVDLDGNHVAVCFGYPVESVYKQSIYTALRGRGGMKSKTAVPEDTLKALWSKAESTGMFTPAGRELKCPINRKFSDDEIAFLKDWCEDVANAIKEHGLKE